MKPLRLTALVVALLAGAGVNAPWAADAPKPVAPASAAPSSKDWRDVSPDNLVLIETKYGTVAVELSPEFAPNHVARMRKLLRAHFYDGLTFYRVIDGFVAQGGADQDTSATANAPVNPEILKNWPRMKAELDATLPAGTPFTPLGNPDLVAPEVGHVNGFPAGRDPKTGKAWMIQCPGVFAFARDNDEDTATTEFYIVIGEAPRRLDHNLTAFGRVLDGMEYLQKLQRGNPDVDSGVIDDDSKRDPIIRMTLAADLPAKDRPHYQVMKTDSAAFAELKDKKRHPAPEFYHHGPFPNLDICGVSAPVKRINP